MIASPSDVPDARDQVENAIYKWNDANAKTKKIILQPWRWENSSVPVLGGHPQTLINAQGVDDSDIVIALFGSRLGSPTPAAVSGTVEEIDRALAKGTPVHLYFSKAGPPIDDVDTAQLEALRSFKQDMLEKGILGEFTDPRELDFMVWKAIEHDLDSLDPATVSPTVVPTPSIDFQVQPNEDREATTDGKGRTRYRTRHWLEITHTGTIDAENVWFEPVGDESTTIHLSNGGPTIIHPGQVRRLHYNLAMGSKGGAKILRVHWAEGDEEMYRDFYFG